MAAGAVRAARGVEEVKAKNNTLEHSHVMLRVREEEEIDQSESLPIPIPPAKYTYV